MADTPPIRSDIEPLVMRLWAADPLKDQLPDESWIAAQLSAALLYDPTVTGARLKTIFKYYGAAVILGC